MNKPSAKVGALLIVLCALATPAWPQPCAQDDGFNAGLFPGATIYAVAPQTNGQILVGGVFMSINDQPCFNVGRLNHDGSVDATFDAGTVADNGYVAAIAVQPDGKVLIGGAFSSSSDIGTPYLTRLNSDGTVDSSFNTKLTLDGPVSSIAVLSDGKILIAGDFSVIDEFLRQIVARLHTNGTVDTNFDACVASGDGATSLTVLNDGKLLMTGNFSFQSGVTRNGIARLRSNGDVDPTYATGPGIDTGTVYSLAVRGNGKVVIGGNFGSFDFTLRNGIVQLDPDGNVDTSLDPGTGINAGASVFTLLRQNDEKILVGGNFTSFNNLPCGSLIRLNPDGSRDRACDPGPGANNTVSSLALETGGKVLVGGLFTSFNNEQRNGVTRFYGDVPPVHLGMPERRSDGLFQMIFSGGNPLHYMVQASSNLANWIAITNFVAGTNPIPVIDPDSLAHPGRFYRAVSLP